MYNTLGFLLYIDPGTGSMLISVIGGALMTLLFSLRGFFYRSTYYLLGKKYKGVNDFEGQLVFYNEGSNYWHVFKPVLDQLIKTEYKFVYLTSDENDPGLQLDKSICTSHYIGNMDQAFIVLNKLKAKMCVMTTPQLNILRLKRSHDVKHYCYLAHAPMDVHANKKFSFDYYDSVLCGNDYHINNLRQLERDRKSQEKVLLKTGCTYFDEKEYVNDGDRDSILLAPTWGDRTFFAKYGDNIINKLLQGKNKVILRPHPQSWISEKELLDLIISKYETNTLFNIDREVDNSNSLSKARTVICDITSGIIYDFVFLHKKPVLAIDIKWDDGGYESSNIKNDPCTKFLLKDAGKTITVNDLKDINAIINELDQISITEEVIENHIVNFRKAGPIATKQILTLYSEL